LACHTRSLLAAPNAFQKQKKKDSTILFESPILLKLFTIGSFYLLTETSSQTAAEQTPPSRTHPVAHSPSGSNSKLIKQAGAA
jgi:hypothetical protein